MTSQYNQALIHRQPLQHILFKMMVITWYMYKHFQFEPPETLIISFDNTYHGIVYLETFLTRTSWQVCLDWQGCKTATGEFRRIQDSIWASRQESEDEGRERWLPPYEYLEGEEFVEEPYY